MRVAVLVVNDVFDTGLSTVLDTFGIANFVAGSIGDVRTRFTVSVIGVRRTVRTAQGLSVPVAATHTMRRPDVVIVPALGAKTPPTLDAALSRRDVIDAGDLLQTWAAKGTLVAAACTGTFVIAEAGLLAGRAATTTWWLGPFFRQRYPQVDLDETAMIVSSTGRVTAGAALAHLDLALWIVRREHADLADLAARYLLSEPRLSQGAFIVPQHLAQVDPLISRFEQWARTRIEHGFSLAAAAHGAGTSERTLSRRVRAVLGKSPLSYFQDLRVERAIHLLRTTPASVDEIAGQVGYADGVTLRSLLRQRTGRGVREIRREP
jgi:transcriptional regulator GlxA family with amidase domain